MSLRNEPVSAGRGLFCKHGECIRLVSLSEFEQLVNSQTLTKLRNYSFGALGVLFVASLGVGWVVAGRVLRPIGRITAVARDIQATDLSRRIELPGPEDELKQLADQFDAMLARLDAAFAAQRQFTADASHELRNPLAIIRTNVDVALADPQADPDDLRHTITVVKRASDRMARLVDDLLALARRQEPTLEHEPVDLGVAVTEASDDFVVPAAARNIVLDRAIAPAWSSPATATPSSAPWPTCSTTPSASPPPAPASAWPPTARATGPGSPSPTKAPASPPRTSPTSSTASGAADKARPAPTAAPASAWPSSARSPRATAAASASSPRSASAPPSSSGSPSPPRLGGGADPPPRSRRPTPSHAHSRRTGPHPAVVRPPLGVGGPPLSRLEERLTGALAPVA